MTKDTAEILTKAIQLKPDIVEFLVKRLSTWGDVTDGLRVTGHLGQAMVDMAQWELQQIKLQDEDTERKAT